MSQEIIQLSDLTKRYDSLTAVDHLSLTIQKGEVFGLLGPNGAGKSTTILMMLGLTEPTSGSVQVCGINSTTNPIEVKRRVGYLPDDVGFYDNRSAIENLMFTARLNSIPENVARARAVELLERVGLSDVGAKKSGKFSRGMRQRLGLADVLIKDPEVIILDEPTLGIDPKGVREFLELIAQLSKEEQLTVLLSSHHLHQVQQVCDRVGIFVSGKLIAQGDIPTLSKQLFSAEPFMIQVAVESTERDERLLSSLENLASVNTVKFLNGEYLIGCSTDITPHIARVVIESGYGLTHLHKKEYGLDDIYNRYFEGAVI
ncbi:ABC-2 type transport system ATP-binding protein [bacterium A37T11]|nr:ABC-2 type transport system ATP-binding protein [bacterium A37T11]